MKKCIRCDNWVSKDSFSKDKTRKDGLHPYCSICRSTDHKRYILENPVAQEKRKIRSKQWKNENPKRYKQLLKNWKVSNKEKKQMLDRKSQLWTCYRLTIEDYLIRLENQGGVCAICKLNKKLYVDHDHSCCSDRITCGECVRGLICQKCNMFVSYLEGEYKEYIDIAIKYIG